MSGRVDAGRAGRFVVVDASVLFSCYFRQGGHGVTDLTRSVDGRDLDFLTEL